MTGSLLVNLLSAIATLAVFFVPLAWMKRAYWKRLFREIRDAYNDVTADLP